MNINILAVATVGVYALMHTIAKSQISVPPFTFIGIAMGTVSLLAFATSFALAEGRAPTVTSLAWLVAYGVVNFIGFVLYLRVIGGMPIMQYQLVSIVGPVIGGAIAFALLGEPVAPRFISALPFLGLGLYLALSK
jgi:drug/metabolite transporter (DMT)-like permease